MVYRYHFPEESKQDRERTNEGIKEKRRVLTILPSPKRGRPIFRWAILAPAVVMISVVILHVSEMIVLHRLTDIHGIDDSHELVHQ